MPNDEGITALHNAVCAGHTEIVKFLVQFGVNANAADSDGWFVLHFELPTRSRLTDPKLRPRLVTVAMQVIALVISSYHYYINYYIKTQK